MTKIRTILKSSKDADGRQQVLLLLSDRGKRSYFPTGFSATPQEFDASKDVGRFVQGRGIPSFKVQRREEDGSLNTYSNKEANDKLAELEGRAQDILRRYIENHVDWGFEQFRSDFTNAPKRNLFYAFSKSVLEEDYIKQDKFTRAKIARQTLESLERYDKNLQKKFFQDITPAYIQGYIKYCRNQGHGDNTIGMRLREIRCFYNIAIREKVVSKEMYPFSSGREDGKAKIPKQEQSKTNHFLPYGSMRKMAAAVLSDPIMDRTRHLYLFSYYCRGMNWKDMALLTRDSFYDSTVIDADGSSHQVSKIFYKRSKTKSDYDITVTSVIQRELDWFKDNTVLFDNYVIPIIHVNQTPDKLDEYLAQILKRANRSLKKIAAEINLPDSQRKISFYSARHSFAMTMLAEGKSTRTISQALGHKSIRTTENYLKKLSSDQMAEETFIDLSAPEKKPAKKKRATKKKTEKPAKPTKKKETKKAPAQ